MRAGKANRRRLGASTPTHQQALGLLTLALNPTRADDRFRPARLAPRTGRLNVDTTVQEKYVRFPTDTRLYDRARARLVKAAGRRDIKLRQNYRRVGKRLLLQVNRYMHARQTRRAERCRKKLRTILGRVIRNIERKYPRPDEKLENLMGIAKRIHG